MNVAVGDRVWTISQEEFVAAWNAAATLDEAAATIRALASGPVPRWSLMARAGTLRKEGVPLKPLASNTCPVA